MHHNQIYVAGIYIHIPFCKQACHYCDFHFSTNLSLQNQLINCICKEAQLRKEYLNQEEITTIYFGGGTPSLLTEAQIADILNNLHKNNSISKDVEITLEGNPDDLELEFLHILKKNSINRLSIGIQSFHDPFLKYMNRIHNSSDSTNCVRNAQQVGFNNISVDLIYGIPYKNHEMWMKDLEKVKELNVKHISSYCLTIESGTVFGNQKKKGLLVVADDDFSSNQYQLLLKFLSEYGFEQYEISNFSKPGYISKHNSNYWKDKPYLGLGPGAHSYDRNSRGNNVSNNPAYIKSISKDNASFTVEHLSWKDKANDYILTSLRTTWGCDLSRLENLYQVNSSHFLLPIKKMEGAGLLIIQNNVAKLTEKGMLLADSISTELFV